MQTRESKIRKLCPERWSPKVGLRPLNLKIKQYRFVLCYFLTYLWNISHTSLNLERSILEVSGTTKVEIRSTKITLFRPDKVAVLPLQLSLHMTLWPSIDNDSYLFQLQNNSFHFFCFIH